jgi:hypothetical protein
MSSLIGNEEQETEGTRKRSRQRILNDLYRTRLSSGRMIRSFPSPPGSKLSLFLSIPVCRRSSLYIRENGVGGDGEKAWSSINNLILSGSRVGERKRRKKQRNTRNERKGKEGRKGGGGERLSEGQDSTYSIRGQLASSLNGA